MLYQQGQYEQGIIFAQQTCDLAKSYSLTNEPIYAYSLNLLAILYKSMGRYEQALPLSQQVLEIVGKSLGTDHPEYANCLNKLAVL
ncbi:tetratricopeptide repeat protein, partial [Microcystis aeruginosa]